MFGSTQLVGCQGDFCKFDVGFIESYGAALHATKRDATLSEFRQKLLNTGGGPVAGFTAGQGLRTRAAGRSAGRIAKSGSVAGCAPLNASGRSA